MTKLFALEEKNVDDGSNELLIDKVLKYKEKGESPISLTADIIKQRTELKKDINEQLNKEPENEDGSSDNGDGDGEEKKEGEDEEGQGSDDSSSNSDTQPDSKKDEGNLSDQADDKDALKGMIGSGLNNDEGSAEEGSEKPAQESFKSKVKLSHVFAPIKASYGKYLVSMESFNVPKKLAMEEQPIVYVKDAVLEALNNLVEVANNYIGKNKTFIDSNSESVKNVNERLTVLKQFIENRKFHFNHSIVTDQKLLTEISVTDKTDIRETSKYLVSYIENSNKFVNLVLNNEFNAVGSALSNADFISEDGDFVYKTMLPGFNVIRVHLDNYESYLKANIENFHYYQLKTFKTEYLYNLDGVVISEDKEIDFVMSNLDKLLIDLSMTIDNFSVVNTNLNKLIDELKVFIYGVEKDEHANLAELDIDSKVKDFIRFKLVSEAYYCNAAMLLNYILNVDTVINKCIDLKS